MNKDSTLVVVTTLSSEWEAGLIVNRLQELGIAASATGGATAEFRSEAPGAVRVLVDSHDQDEASEVVNEFLEARRQRRTKEAKRAQTSGKPTGSSTSGSGFMLLIIFEPLFWIAALAGPFATINSLGPIAVFGLLVVSIPTAIWLHRRFGRYRQRMI